jgi:hypothetical protein
MTTRRWLLAPVLVLMLLILAGCGGNSAVAFENRTVCGTIAVSLTNTQTGVEETRNVAIGETVTIDVAPNVPYDYVVDYTAAGTNDEGFRCIAVQRGEVTVPQGSTQYFNLTAVTPTPSAVP